MTELGSHPGQPRRAHVGAQHLRGRRLHDLRAPRLGRLDAGPHRGVPRARRRRHPARAAPDHLEHLHRSRDRDGRLAGAGHRGRTRRRHRAQAAAGGEPAREDDGHQGRLREAASPARAAARSSAASSSARAPPSSSTRSRSPSNAGSRSTRSRACSPSTRRCRAASPTRPVRCTSCDHRHGTSRTSA